MAWLTQYWLPAAASILVLLTIANAVRSYRRLSHIPGPPLAAVSRLWLLKKLLGPRSHLDLYEANMKYGSLVRIGPNLLVTCDPELVRRMNAPRSPYRRGEWFTVGRFKPGVDNVLSERDEGKHDKRRKQMAPGYSGKENPRLESDIDERIRDLISLIERKYICTTKEPGKQMDIARKIQFFTVDVTSGLGFGQPFGDMIADEDKFGYIKTVEESIPMIVWLSEFQELRYFLEKSSLMKLLAPSSTDKIGIGRAMAIAKQKVAERFGDERKVEDDMLGSFVKHGLGQEDAEVETVLQLLAGSDTTATAVKVLILYLITTPRVLWRLRSEIDEGVRNGNISSPIQDSEARNLPYLQACIKEGLRVWPPVPGLFNMVVPPEGDTVNGLFIPGGTNIGMSFWGISRSIAIFGSDAEFFRPERWLDVPKVQLQKMERNNELTFGYGRSKCLGQAVALVELNKIVVELLRRYEITLVDPSKPMKSVNVGIFLQSEMWVQISRRGEAMD